MTARSTDVVLAGAIEFSPTEIAVILALLALYALAHLAVIVGELLQPFTLRRVTGGWPLAFIPLVGPHMAVHHWGLGTAWHVALGASIGGCVVLAALADALRDPAAGVVATLSVVLLLAHYGTRLRIAWVQRGRPRHGFGRWWWAMPVASIRLPFAYIDVIRAQRRGEALPAA